METKVMRGLSYSCNVFAFVLIGYVFAVVGGVEQSIAIVLTGIGLYMALYLRSSPLKPRPVAWWAIRVVCILWSFAVYAEFVAFFQSSIGKDSSRVPIWMQDAAPFIVALVPLFLLWFVRYEVDLIEY